MKILIIDPSPRGHQNFYLSLIVKSLESESVSILTSPGNRELEDHFTRRGISLGDWHIIPPVAESAKEVLKQASELVLELGFDQVFIPYLDSFLMPLIYEIGRFPCPVSGIWFHPYALDSRYAWLPAVEKRWKHRGVIHRGLKKPGPELHISHIYFLDPLSPAKLSRVNSSIASSVLEDPWERLPELSKDEARRAFGLPENRMIFLHIGSSERRKGLGITIRAFHKLSKDPGLSGRIFLLRVGPIDRLVPAERNLLDRLVSGGVAGTVPCRVSEQNFMEYFAASDWILIPYRKFRFSSGILSNAIAAGKPVIATDAGLLGKTVKKEGLGLTLAHPRPADLAKAVRVVANSSLSFQDDQLSIATRNPDCFTVAHASPTQSAGTLNPNSP